MLMFADSELDFTMGKKTFLYTINLLSAKKSSGLMLNLTCLLPVSLQKNHLFFSGIDLQLSGQHLPA